LQRILLVYKVDSPIAETAGHLPDSTTGNGSETGLTPVQLTIDEDPRCIKTQIVGYIKHYGVLT